MYDRVQQLAWDAQFAVGILANLDSNDFELVPLDVQGRLTSSQSRDYARRGLVFAGTIGIVNGVPQTALEIPLDERLCDGIGRAFVVMVEDELCARIVRQGGPDLTWLKRLHAAPDMRSVN